MNKAQNEASAYPQSLGTSASTHQNAKCSNCIKLRSDCIKLKQDIMELKKKLGRYNNPQRKNQSASPCDDMGKISFK